MSRFFGFLGSLMFVGGLASIFGIVVMAGISMLVGGGPPGLRTTEIAVGIMLLAAATVFAGLVMIGLAFYMGGRR